MIDPLIAVRNAFAAALTGITYNTVPVPVYEDINPNDEKIYIIISTQTATEISTFSSFDFDCSILIDIVHKQAFSVTKYVVDTIAQTIHNRIKPTPSTNGLGVGSVEYLNVRVDNDSHLSLVTDTETIQRRLIRFSLKVNEKQ